MSDPTEQRADEVDGWPLPTPDVLRELESSRLGSSESEWPVGQQPRRSAGD